MVVSRRNALTSLAGGALLAAGCAGSDERDHLELFDAVWRTVADNYYDAGAAGTAWREARRLWRPRAAKAGSRAELYLAVLVPMLERLNASHIQLRPSSSLILPPHTSLPMPGMRRGDRPVYLTSADEAGMGASFTWDGQRLIATRVDRKSPAAAAGLKTGDPVLARRYRRTPTGGRLSLINHRNNAEIVLEWDKGAPQPNHRYAPFAERSAVIRFNAFDRTTVDWLLKQLAQAHDGVILDLRDNRGGLIGECHRALSALTPSGTAIGLFRSRRREYRLRTASSDPIASTGKLVVLTGMRTVSGGEIFADVLRRNRNAVLVGDRTAGAVLASQNYSMPDGGTLMLPYADFFTPSGERLENLGVAPDVASAGRDSMDMMDVAKALLRKT